MNFLLDTHVHYHSCYRETEFFEGAYENFQLAAKKLGLTSNFTGCLFLTECSGDFYFKKLQQQVGKRVAQNWLVRGTLEDCALMLEKNEKERLILAAGRQIVTNENLEVLALGTSAGFDDGRTLRETVRTVRDQGALPVIPWGFGKWLGKRGKIVSDYLEDVEERDLFLGDSACRLRYGTQPIHFEIATTRGIRIIPGSDTLPLKSRNRAAGGYGIMISGISDDSKPASGLKILLRNKEQQFRIFGKRSGLLSFCYSQIAMQLKKQMKKRTRG